MDLKAQMGQFLAPEFSLAQLAERLYQAETDPDRVVMRQWIYGCLLYTSPSPRDKRQSRMPSSA